MIQKTYIFYVKLTRKFGTNFSRILSFQFEINKKKNEEPTYKIRIFILFYISFLSIFELKLYTVASNLGTYRLGLIIFKVYEILFDVRSYNICKHKTD